MSEKTGMATYIVKRVISTIPVMLIVAITVFLISRLGSSDPAAVIAGDYAGPERIDEIRKQLGLDQPMLQQFWVWSSGVVRGDLGTSIFSGKPVSELIANRVGPTVSLAVLTMTFAIILAIPMGVVAGWKAGSLLDRIVMIFAVLAFSFPVFLIGYIMVYIFSLKLAVLPVQGFRELRDGLWPFLRHLLLPSVSLGSVYIALIARMTRASMIAVLQEDYIRTARAKGLSYFRVLLIHALKNAAVPVATVIGVGFAGLIGGVVVTETVFNIPGLGRLTATAIVNKDYPIIQGVVLLFSFTYVLINLLIDILYTLLDPRIKY